MLYLNLGKAFIRHQGFLKVKILSPRSPSFYKERQENQNKSWRTWQIWRLGGKTTLTLRKPCIPRAE